MASSLAYTQGMFEVKDWDDSHGLDLHIRRSEVYPLIVRLGQHEFFFNADGSYDGHGYALADLKEVDAAIHQE